MSGIERYIKDWLRPKPPKPPKPEPVEPVPPPAPSPVVPGRVTMIPGPFARRLYSDKANTWVRSDGVAFTFAGLKGYGPQLYMIRDGRAEVYGWTPPIPGSETENWYWNPHGEIYLPDGPALIRYNPFTGAIITMFRLEDPNAELWQCHSSHDDTTHSGTIRINGAAIGTVVSLPNGSQQAFSSPRTLDESQISPDGRWLVIKETDNNQKLWNRIINLETLAEYELPPGESIGHSDLGPGFIIGADTWEGYAIRMNLQTRERKSIFSTWNMGHVSVRGDRALWSRQELGHLALGGINDVLTTPRVVFEHGQHSDEYDQQVRANLSPCGTRATFTVNDDLYVLEL